MTNQQFDALVRSASKDLLRVAKDLGPALFSCFFGAVISNTLGNMTDEYWAKFSEAKPCSEPGCNCHEPRLEIMNGLAAARRDFKACVDGGFPS